jgi:hypothetical protein
VEIQLSLVVVSALVRQRCGAAVEIRLSLVVVSALVRQR